MSKETIEVHADAELKRRIVEAAAKRSVPVEEYCLDAIEQKLQDDLLLGGEEDYVTLSPRKQDPTLWEELRELHERILARRGGKPIDIDIIEQLRSEREDELMGMR